MNAIQRTIGVGLIAVMMMVSFPQKAEAFVASAGLPVTDVLVLSVLTSWWATDEVEKQTKDSVLAAVKVATANAFRYFTQKLAYDGAVYLTSGGTGEKPLLETQSFGDYITDTATDAAGVAITSIGERVGVDFCAPSQGPLLQAEILLGLASDTQVQPPQPQPQITCTLDNMLKNLDEYLTRFSSTSKAFEQVGLVFRPDGNDLGFVLKAHEQVITKKSLATEQAEKERAEGQGFKAQKSAVGKFITTPGSFIAQEAFGLNSAKQQQAQQGEFESMTASDSLGYILANSTIMFANTLAQRGLQRLMDQGFISVTDLFGQGDSIFSESSLTGFGGREAAKLAYADLLTPQVSSGGELSLLAEFSSCPSTSPSINNCVVDQKFVSAVNFANQGTAITIAEAMKKNLLDPNWKLLPESHELNSKVECRLSGFCFSNIKKLRRARVLPIGFELAAQNSPKDNPWTLREVVEGFNKCNSQGQADEKNRYCHLIDPNWILKAPPVRCAAKGYGQTLLSSNGSVRSEYCADVQDCVATDSKGNCIGGWGYCLAEKNVWRIDADTCPAQFGSCTVYTGRDGSQGGYLANTIDQGICSSNTVGCRGYFSYQVRNTATGELEWYELGVNATNGTAAQTKLGQNGAVQDPKNPERVSGVKRYFNKNVTVCSEKDAGCTAVVRADKSTIHVKLAMDSLACYDINTATRDIELPYSVEDAKKLYAQKGCNAYASVCAEEELGCKAYKPSNGGIEVTGIVKAVDSCASECVGYNAYKQEETSFEAMKFPVYTLPAKGTQCTLADAGCDEFTSLDKQVAGGESKEYYSFTRICKKPSEVAATNFYTWEGSDTVGYQIRAYQLEANSDNTPRYNTNDATLLAKYAAECNKDAYNNNAASLDCREIYNAEGVVSYKFISKTITISNNCSPLRKTESTKSDCEVHGGTWTDGGFCLIQAIPSESTSCSAAAAGCRAYQGPNQNIVVSQTYENVFEVKEDTGWGSAGIVSESLLVGGHSLSVQKRTFDIMNEKFNLVGEQTYSISFWAKGDGVIDVGVKDTKSGTKYSFIAQNTNVLAKTASSTWKQYRFGPITLPKSETLQMYFDTRNISSAGLFVDNLELIKGESFAIIKNSAKVPLSCDANPSDAIPGAALGCSLYADQENKNIAVKSFSNLCRKEAIGCELVRDTRNTVNDNTELYNLSVGESNGTKNDSPGDDIIIGGDRDLRVVVNKDSVCGSAAIGCRAFGVKRVEGTGSTATTKYDTKYLVDNPLQYNSTLCQSTAEGCDAFISKGNAISYFKDPKAINKLCDYRENVTVKNGSVETVSSGWFHTGEVGNIPCYSDYKLSGNKYGVWSNGDQGYAGKTATCTSQYDQCFQLVDHATVDNKGKPTSYYIIDNNKVDKTSCKGNVSRQQGCALFQDTRNPSLSYSSGAAYASSEEKFGAPVAASDYRNTSATKQYFDAYEQIPKFNFRGNETQCVGELIAAIKDTSINKNRYICELFAKYAGQGKSVESIALCASSGTGPQRPLSFVGNNEPVTKVWDEYITECNKRKLDSNVVIKVRRDRECGEWLSCNSFVKAENAPVERQLQCTGLGLCAGLTTSSNGSVQCSKWLTPDQATLYGKKLDVKNYSARNVGYEERELSGLTVGNAFTPAQYEVVELPNGNSSTYTLGVAFSDEYRLGFGTGTISGGSLTDSCVGKTNGTNCKAGELQGACNAGRCMLTVTGEKLLAANPPKDNGVACRIYPERDAPFGSKVVSEWSGATPKQYKDQQFSNANVCWDGTDSGYKSSNCSCSYQKLKFNTNLYVDIGAPMPRGICQGGYTIKGESKTGRVCGEDVDDVYEFCRDERGDDPASGVQSIVETASLYDTSLSADERATIASKEMPQHGTCQPPAQNVQQFRGWEGFCMESDSRTPANDAKRTHACSSWYPLDAAPGIFDLYNQNKKAGYQAAKDVGTLWCLQSSGNMSVTKNVKVPYEGFDQSASTNAYSYEAATMVSPSAPASITGTFGANGTWSVGDFPQYTDLRRENPSPLSTKNLDGILVKPKYNGWELGDMYIANDNTVRCYVQDKKYNHQNSGTTLEQICGKYASAVGASMKIIERPSAGTWWMGITYRKINKDTTQDWMALSLRTDTMDSGDCNQNNNGDSRVWHHFTDAAIGGNPYVGAGIFAQSTNLADRCDALGEDGGCGVYGDERWLFGVRYKFGADGKIVQHNNTMCTGEGAIVNSSANITFTFREMCTTIAQGYDEENDVGYAYTQRLWPKQADLQGQLIYARQSANVGKTLSQPYRVSNGNAGIYYAEDGGIYGSFATTKKPVDPHYTYIRAYQDAHVDESIRGGAGQVVIVTDQVYKAASYGCPQGACGEYQNNKNLGPNYKLENNDHPASVVALQVFSELFARVITAFDYKDTTGKYGPSTLSINGADVRGTEGVPPTIAAINEGKLTEDGGTQVMRLGAFNVNGKYADGEIVYGIGDLNATVRFAAWADTDQMPLKKTLVEWNDGTKSGGAQSKFKNRKPYCSTPTTPVGYCSNTQQLPNLTCRTDADCKLFGQDQGSCIKEPGLVFGNDPDACSPGFFEYSHVYSYDRTCGVENPSLNLNDSVYPKHITLTKDLLEGPLKKLAGLDPQPGDNLCIFKPKVQIADAWNITNGYCAPGQSCAQFPDCKVMRNGIFGCYLTGINHEKTPDINENAATPFAGSIYILEPKQ